MYHSREKNRELMRNNQKYVEVLKKKPTKEELIVLDWLKENKVKFMFQKGFIVPFHRIVDFYLPKPHKVILEIDGKIHLYLKDKDYTKDSTFLEKRGFRTIRILNEEVSNGTFKLKLKCFLEK